MCGRRLVKTFEIRTLLSQFKFTMIRCAFLRRIRIKVSILCLNLFCCRKLPTKIWEKLYTDSRFLKIFNFYYLKYVKYISVKIKVLAVFSLKVLRIKTRANSKAFIKIRGCFYMCGWKPMKIPKNYKKVHMSFTFIISLSLEEIECSKTSVE